MATYEKQEKVLWYIQIALFIIALGSNWYTPVDFYVLNVVLAVVSVVSLTADRFYYSKMIQQDVYPSYKIAYILILLYAVVLLLQFMGILNISLLNETSRDILWILVPAVALLWKTKFIAFREWDQDQK